MKTGCLGPLWPQGSVAEKNMETSQQGPLWGQEGTQEVREQQSPVSQWK